MVNIPKQRKLYLSANDKVLTGLCGGIAEYFHVDSSLVRLGWIIFTVITGIFPAVVAYVIASIVIPKESGDEIFKT
jgi:phage shock protein C